MLKIFIVMLTTAGFAGLLIADPYGPVASAARRTTAVTANASARPAAQQTPPEPLLVAKPIAQPDNPVLNDTLPVVAVVVRTPNAPASAVTPARQQLAASLHGRQDRNERDRVVAHPHLHMARLSNMSHHLRRHA